MNDITSFMLGGQTFIVDPKAQLGSGSEGIVVESPHDPSTCVKLFHPSEAGDATAQKIAAYRARKVLAICANRPALPPQFVLPVQPVYDPRGIQVRGYQMPRVPAEYEKFITLLDPGFRASNRVGLQLVAELFADLFGDLKQIHDSGFVVGDLNIGCIMLHPHKGRAWVDTDSWSYPGFPCLATTELYAHPDLYANLSSGNAHVEPAPRHDRFSLAVMFSQFAIPGAHPFRMGKHPTVKGLQNRTRAGLTLYDASVNFPQMLGSPEVLSDEVLHELVERLKRHTDAPLSPELLRDFAQNIVNCKTCGTDFHASRKRCPKCNEVTAVQVSGLGNFTVAELYNVLGTLLFAQVVGTDLYLVCRQGSQVYVVRIDERGKATTLGNTLPDTPGARYRFFEDHLVVCPDPKAEARAPLELYRIEGSTLRRLQDTSTGVLKGESAVFDTSARFFYRTAGNMLVRCEPFGPSSVLSNVDVTEVYQQQSWFTADRTPGTNREVIFGYHRALRNWEWFVIHGNAEGNSYRNSAVGDLGLRKGEAVEDFAVYFARDSVLLCMVTSYNGHDYARYAVIGLNGVVHLNKTVDSTDDTYPLWSTLRGKLHQGKSVLHVTSNGIVKQPLPDGTCQTLAVQGKLTIDDQLLRIGGKVGIVRRSGIFTLANNIHRP